MCFLLPRLFRGLARLRFLGQPLANIAQFVLGYLTECAFSDCEFIRIATKTKYTHWAQTVT